MDESGRGGGAASGPSPGGSGPGPVPVSRLLKAKDVFLSVQALDAADRPAQIDASCGDDADLRELVLRLLKGDAATVGLDGIASGARAAIDAVLGEAPGAVIGPYTLVRQIGEGGFGSVFLASQSRPVRRDVALKILKAGMDTRQVVARFEQERQALAMMDHPGIAKVFDAGATSAGRPYFAMEYCTGSPITAYCDRATLGIRERLGLFLEVCSAIQHAHHKGIIHRDIKPTNILVHEVDGRAIAKVIDFGIAKATQGRLTEQTLMTERFQLVGTLEYMSPEQAEASADIDTRADVYSLGVVLYELLTGTTPLDAGRLRSAAYAEMHRIIRDTDPQAPSARVRTGQRSIHEIAAARSAVPGTFVSLLRGDLDWIVMKAIEKDRQNRYQSATALAEDIQRYLAQEPVLAAPQGGAYHVRKFIRRHRAPVLAGAGIVVALIAGLVGTTIGFLDARTQTREARYETYVANMTTGIKLLEIDNVEAAREFLAACSPDRRGWEWNYANSLTDRSDLLIDRREEPLIAVGLSPDAGSAATLSAGGVLRMIDPRHRTVLEERRLVTGPMTAGAVSHDGRWAVVASEREGVRLFDTSANAVRTLQGAGNHVDLLVFSIGGRAVAGAGRDGTITVWEVQAGALVGSVHAATPPGVLAVPDDPAVIAYAPAGRGTVTIQPVRDARAPWTLASDPGLTTRTIAFSPDGATLFIGNNTSDSQVWNVADGTRKAILPSSRGSVEAASFSPDARLIGLSTWDGSLSIMDTAASVVTKRLVGNARAARSIVVTPEYLATACQDGSARAWRLSESDVKPFAGHAAAVHSVVFSPDGGRVLSASEDGTARVWDARTGAERVKIRDPIGSMITAEFDPSGSRFVTASPASPVKIWDAGSGRLMLTLPPESTGSAHASFSPDGKSIATGGQYGDAGIWDASTGLRRTVFDPKMDGYFCIRFSPDGSRVLTTGTENYACVWDSHTGRRLFTLRGHDQWILDGAYSRDGTRIVTASEDQTVRIWNARSGEPIAVLRGHRARVGAARFSPDGKRIFSAAGDSTLDVWDADQAEPRHVGRLLATFAVGTDYVLDLDVSPDGTMVVTSGVQGTPRVWDSLLVHERSLRAAPDMPPAR